MRRDTRVWPFTPLGTVVVVPVLAVGILAGIYGFFWLVQFLGEIAVNAAKVKQ